MFYKDIYFSFANSLKKRRCDFKETGEVSEWSKEHAWKVCIPQKGIEGSNPSLSAKFNMKNR
jgi:hypothetical protein